MAETPTSSHAGNGQRAPSTTPQGVGNGDAGAAGSGRSRASRGQHTLLDPEKTNHIPVLPGRGLGFQRDIDHACGRIPAKVLVFGGPAVGGGWLLVEMCIVDASILFICDIWVPRTRVCF
jgi:hypothetical protein